MDSDVVVACTSINNVASDVTGIMNGNQVTTSVKSFSVKGNLKKYYTSKPRVVLSSLQSFLFACYNSFVINVNNAACLVPTKQAVSVVE